MTLLIVVLVVCAIMLLSVWVLCASGEWLARNGKTITGIAFVITLILVSLACWHIYKPLPSALVAPVERASERAMDYIKH